MRQLFPPVAPEAPDFEPQNEGVETKLIDSVTLRLPFSRETRVHNPHSILDAALPPISRPAPTTEIKAPTKVHSAGHV